MASSIENQQQDPWFLKSTFPVYFPSHSAFTIPDKEFDAFLRGDLKRKVASTSTANSQADEDLTVVDADTSLVSDTSTTAYVREDLGDMTIDSADITMAETVNATAEDDLAETSQKKTLENDHPFMKGLLSRHAAPTTSQTRDMQNKMLTENSDLAHRSTGETLVDLFTELEDVISGPRLLRLLDSAWNEDPVSTLKIIFNARSIHLGKGSRQTFYRCAGWLAKYHPLTLIANLPWLSRPVIQKKMEKEEKKSDEDTVFVEEGMTEDDPARFDIRNGVSHGYWKDLLNLVALRVNGKLDVLANPREILNIEREKNKEKWPKDQETAKTMRHEKRDARHEAAVKAFNEDPVYRALHLAVARLFAAQLRTDLALLRSDDLAAKRKVSLCAKWAPSTAHFHDKHTFIVSSIAEIMYPLPVVEGFSSNDEVNSEQRDFYLRHARESYRKDVAALRKQLECVERDITTNSFENIKYDRVPSIAMNTYAPLFARKDTARFEKYIDKVARGKARISGATLLPSTLIKEVREASRFYGGSHPGTLARKRKRGMKDLVEMRIKVKTMDGQWKTLVQRMKDSGTLENCIAVADVSGSMTYPQFPDGTCPIDSSIGLSLLISEVTKPPFGGTFITFSNTPTVEKIDLSKGLLDKFSSLASGSWSMSTDFVAVFEKLILPMAIDNKIKQEDMVKRIFVFSDMHFNSARGCSQDAWTTSYERISKKFHDAGYEMPELIFWNLAGGRAGYLEGPGEGDPVAPKPVTAADKGTALVSGYSQGMLKVLLDSNAFADEDTEGEITQEVGDDGEVVVDKRDKQKLTPLNVVSRAIGHPAYDMLQLVD